MKNNLIPIFLLVLVLLMVSCGKNEQSTEAIDISTNPHTEEIVLTEEQFTAGNMKMGAFSQQSFSNKLKANGYIDVPPERKASVSVKLGGFVKSLSILPGDKVRQGETLFTLENPDFIQLQQDYLETLAQLAYLQSDYERQKNLAAENVTSQKNFLKAEADYQTAKARLAGLMEKLKLLNINLTSLQGGVIQPVVSVPAPISGYIAKVNITKGMHVSPAEVAVEIVSTEHMHVELQVFEKDVPFLEKGQHILFNVNGLPDKLYEGEVYLIGKTVEGDTRTINIHGHIHEEDKLRGILPGMYVEATIEVATAMHTVLPAEAVMESDGDFVVLLHTGKSETGYTFKKQVVKVGASTNEWIEIVNSADFKTDAMFLVKGGFNLVGAGGGHDH